MSQKMLPEAGWIGDVKVATMVTDRDPSVAKFLRENYPLVKHLYDAWHIAKV